eukprot:31900-Rhodomonas_salina.1
MPGTERARVGTSLLRKAGQGGEAERLFILSLQHQRAATLQNEETAELAPILVNLGALYLEQVTAPHPPLLLLLLLLLFFPLSLPFPQLSSSSLFSSTPLVLALASSANGRRRAGNWEQGAVGRAEEVFRRAVRVREATLGPEHRSTIAASKWLL